MWYPDTPQIHTANLMKRNPFTICLLSESTSNALIPHIKHLYFIHCFQLLGLGKHYSNLSMGFMLLLVPKETVRRQYDMLPHYRSCLMVTIRIWVVMAVYLHLLSFSFSYLSFCLYPNTLIILCLVFQIYSVICVTVQSHLLWSITQDEKKAERRAKTKKVSDVTDY